MKKYLPAFLSREIYRSSFSDAGASARDNHNFMLKVRITSRIHHESLMTCKVGTDLATKL